MGKYGLLLENALLLVLIDVDHLFELLVDAHLPTLELKGSCLLYGLPSDVLDGNLGRFALLPDGEVAGGLEGEKVAGEGVVFFGLSDSRKELCHFKYLLC